MRFFGAHREVGTEILPSGGSPAAFRGRDRMAQL